MRYLLDTNVLSEFVSVRPVARVTEWLSAQEPRDLAASVMSLGEIERGVVRLGEGARRTRLTTWLRRDLPAQFGARIIGVDTEVALAWGRLMTEGQIAGRPLPVVDGLIIATAQVHGLTLVTRNTSDCAGRGVPTLDPWVG